MNNIMQDLQLKQSSYRDKISEAYFLDETVALTNLIKQAKFDKKLTEKIQLSAKQIIDQNLKNRKKQGGIDAFLNQYDLSTNEGIALMCLAEALLRVPDKTTIDKLISDKLSTSEWKKHLKLGNSMFVNAATWSLMFTGKIFSQELNTEKSLSATLSKLIGKVGESMLRPIIIKAMEVIGKQFVMGTSIENALTRAKTFEDKGYTYSYDMLGEAAKTKADAELYFQSYIKAINEIGEHSNNQGPIKSSGISIKLSALHPRYEFAKKARMLNELAPKLLELAKAAKRHNIGLTVDAEESERLEISLDIIEKVFTDKELNGYEGFGIALQSYQKRAPFVIDYLADLAKRANKKIMLRLIKGAYWDGEIKNAQVNGLSGYPVFTRKNSTDVSFIACAQLIKKYGECFYPQFGTHNAYSVAAVKEIMGDNNNFEFQCLHGMGNALYDDLVKNGSHCRIYAPVGTHKDLLGYLVRRLLENGANTNFVNLITHNKDSINKLASDPIKRIDELKEKPHPKIPLPREIYFDPKIKEKKLKEKQKKVINTKDKSKDKKQDKKKPEDKKVYVNRLNSKGIELTDIKALDELQQQMNQALKITYEAGPIVNGDIRIHGDKKAIYSPGNTENLVGNVYYADKDDVELAITSAHKANKTWGQKHVFERAYCLDHAAFLFEENMPTLMALLSKEAGKQLADCVSEVREAIDFCRYYAEKARKDLITKELAGPTGELNTFTLYPRGIIACISPWNFPLAIFAGQVLAALVCGNTVIAKPADQTPLVASFVIKLLHKAGIPKDALHLLPGRGSAIGPLLTSDNRISGVMFTGSTDTAKFIQKSLTERDGPIVPFVAETGGQNTMIVDSSALPEQVVTDVIASAFHSAGQRCSALRVLYLQDEIADTVIEMLKGAMDEIELNDPSLLACDVGPVIDKPAFDVLKAHADKMQKEGKLIHKVSEKYAPKGHYFAPRAFEIESVKQLKTEVFGPILHIIRYNNKNLDKILDEIKSTGFGLTLGIQSRIDTTINYIIENMPIGNIYVNRNMIGAVVGVQPFGGEGLSGTGPKAGGPYYLPRLCTERTVSKDITAAGGNTTLVSLSEDMDK